jgi:hypothetical protein
MKTLLATTGNGLVRATCSIGTDWSVEQHLPNLVVRCLATIPSAHTSVFAGTNAGTTSAVYLFASSCNVGIGSRINCYQRAFRYGDEQARSDIAA